jgi:transketolase
MDALSESSPEDLDASHRAETPARPASHARRMADAVRALAIDATERSQSGHPGLPLAMADAATALWTRFLKFDAADPRWPDRDRFVVSAGHGSMLLYALIYLSGHDGLSIDDIRDFRQIHSPAAGHPEYGEHPAVETTTGPLGQGLATAVGMALAERSMAARFGKSLVDHRTWVIACSGDMMEGVSHEAAALAGQFALSKLTVLYDDSHAAIDGAAAVPVSEDVVKRFLAYGWATKQVDGHDPNQINAALSFAVRSKKPTLIACRTGIGPAMAAGAKALLAWDEPPFATPADLVQRWHAAGSRGATARRSWLKRLARHHQRGEFERVMAGRLPDNWHESVADLKQQIADDRPNLATAAACQRCLEALVPVTPELIGGSAGQAGAYYAQGGGSQPRGTVSIAAGSYGGRTIHYGVREHGMAAAANGMALHGGIIPTIGTLLAFTDYLRPALRLAAIMRQRVIYVLTHDSIGLGEDGPTHQPIEHLASLRATPNLHVFRPCDTMETAECWELALRRTDGPSLLVLSHQALPAWRTDSSENRCARGGYVLAEADGPRQATLLATGSEVPIAMAAREKLAGDSIGAAVVSLPCWELFALQDEAYRAQVLGGAPRVGIEAAGSFGWDQWLGSEGTFIGMPGFGASGPGEDLYRHFGITQEAVVTAVTRRLG